MSLAQFHELAPNVNWEGFLKEIGAPAVNEIDVNQPEFFKEASAAWAAVPIADWQVYLRWQLVHSVAASLPAKFVEENFNFYGKTLTGTKEMLPRWRRCVQATDGQLGEALGQFYVERAFPPEAKAKALEMVRNLIAALRDDLATLDWMSPATREQAAKKLAAIQLKIGYPDKWRDYSAFHVNRGPYVENVQHGDEFETAYDLGKIGKPVDRSLWRHDATDGECILQFAEKRNRVSGGYFAAAFLRPESRRCDELWRDGSCDRARTDARVRRSGQQVRRAGKSE